MWCLKSFSYMKTFSKSEEDKLQYYPVVVYLYVVEIDNEKTYISWFYNSYIFISI